MLEIGKMEFDWEKYSSDPILFIETYFKTMSLADDGEVRLKLEPKCVEIINDYQDFRFNVVKKCRQTGISTLNAAFIAHKMIFSNPNNPENIILLTNKSNIAVELLDKVRRLLLQVPYLLSGSFTVDNRHELRLSNGSIVRAHSDINKVSKCYRPTLVLIDEAAFLLDRNKSIDKIMTTLAIGGSLTLVSSPNGKDSLFYPIYHNDTFRTNELNWYHLERRLFGGLRWVKGDEVVHENLFTLDSYRKMVDDGYKPTSKWYTEMVRLLNNPRAVSQEIDAEFI